MALLHLVPQFWCCWDIATWSHMDIVSECFESQWWVVRRECGLVAFALWPITGHFADFWLKSFLVCMCTNLFVYRYLCPHICGGHRSTLVFSQLFHFIFEAVFHWAQNSWMTRLTSQWTMGVTCSPVLGYKWTSPCQLLFDHLGSKFGSFCWCGGHCTNWTISRPLEWSCPSLAIFTLRLLLLKNLIDFVTIILSIFYLPRLKNRDLKYRTVWDVYINLKKYLSVWRFSQFLGGVFVVLCDL